tara:strand:- start:273 stop:650 length:378 start_codon:yes stop_codon:yes gene_type:complete
LRRLLLLLCPLVLAKTAIAFDGGGYETEKKAKLSTNQSETKTLTKYSEFHQSCMDIQMTMWGEASKLMEDLATAHCYCEYTKVEGLDTITREDENAADVACAQEGTIRKKEAFIWWALPLQRQRL